MRSLDLNRWSTPTASSSTLAVLVGARDRIVAVVFLPDTRVKHTVPASPVPWLVPGITGLLGCFCQFSSRGSEAVAIALPDCVP